MAGKLKKGALVRVNRETLDNSVEAKASDTRFPPYIFESDAEVVDIRGPDRWSRGSWGVLSFHDRSRTKLYRTI